MRWLMERLSAREEEGFTLIELLVVVGILAILAAIAAPRITAVIEKTRAARSEADLKVIASAIERYYADKGVFPTSLAELKSERYLKFDAEMKNASGNFYFYAVNDTDMPLAYVLVDPGIDPNGTTLSLAEDGAVPAMADLSDVYYWEAGTGTPIDLVDVDDSTALSLMYPDTIGSYCATLSGSGTPCRSNMYTE